jgi:hypothetical protein
MGLGPPAVAPLAHPLDTALIPGHPTILTLLALTPCLNFQKKKKRHARWRRTHQYALELAHRHRARSSPSLPRLPPRATLKLSPTAAARLIAS